MLLNLPEFLQAAGSSFFLFWTLNLVVETSTDKLFN